MNTEIPKARPYPRFCPSCGNSTVEPKKVEYTATVKHDGELHQFVIPELNADVCSKCGEMLFGIVADEQISEGLRKHRGLMSPAEIGVQLCVHGIKESHLATALHLETAVVVSWIEGLRIQSGEHDAAMREFFQNLV